MSDVLRISSPCLKSIQQIKSVCFSYDLLGVVSQYLSNSAAIRRGRASLVMNSRVGMGVVYQYRYAYNLKKIHVNVISGGGLLHNNINKAALVIRSSSHNHNSQEGPPPPVQELDDSSSPLSVELDPISSESQFDWVIAQAQQLEESVVIVWMASWCRKCIYLKPKLEKLAADYFQRVRFHCIDVNSVPHKLVVRAGVTKMPTIQLWKDSKKQAEVMGGHKAYLVVNEVREMIENEYNM